MKKILIISYNFIRGIFRFIFFIISRLICEIIYLLTYEKGKNKKLTYRKAKRIRKLTNFKLKMIEKFPKLMGFLGEREYLEFLKKKLNYGV